MNNFKSSLRTSSLFILIIIAVYLVINCIVAIPLMDENNSKIKEINIALKEELKAIKNRFDLQLNDFEYDSVTLTKYDKITSALNAASSSASLKNYLQLRIKSYKRRFESASDLFVYKFNVQNNTSNFKILELKKNFIIRQFKLNCDSAEKIITSNHLAIIKSINAVYAVLLSDTSLQKAETKKQYSAINNYLFFDPMEINFGEDLDSVLKKEFETKTGKQSLNWLYSLSNTLIEKNSASVVIILGMIGVGFFGAIISLIRKNENANNLEAVSSQIFFLIVSSLATSIITYLSLQGGVSFITVGKDVTLNPYFILFICFGASVFSEQIWEKVKNIVK